MFTYALLYEPMRVEMERLVVRLPQAQGRLPERGLRILHLSDTHFQGRTWRERTKIESIRRQVEGLEVDLLIHTGDFVHYDNGLENVLALLELLPPPRLGKFAVLGNHDYTHYDMAQAIPSMWRTYSQARFARRQRRLRPWEVPADLVRFARYVRHTPLDGKRTGSNDTARLTDALAAAGFSVLHNRHVHLACNPGCADGVDLYLAGVDDVSEGRPRIGSALEGIPAGAPTILLSHNPDILISPQIEKVDLVLAGHTHGGQIVLPLWGPAHTQVHTLDRREVAGFIRRGRTQVYISRGIGEGFPLRFAAKPQFAYITVTE